MCPPRLATPIASNALTPSRARPIGLTSVTRACVDPSPTMSLPKMSRPIVSEVAGEALDDVIEPTLRCRNGIRAGCRLREQSPDLEIRPRTRADVKHANPIAGGQRP